MIGSILKLPMEICENKIHKDLSLTVKMVDDKFSAYCSNLSVYMFVLAIGLVMKLRQILGLTVRKATSIVIFADLLSWI